MHRGFHHIRRRAWLAKGLEPFPSKNTLRRILDYIMYAAGLLAPLAILPQILEIYGTKSSAGVSLTTWLLLMVSNVLWVLYSYIHRDRQLLLATSLMVISHLAVVIGILLY